MKNFRARTNNNKKSVVCHNQFPCHGSVMWHGDIWKEVNIMAAKKVAKKAVKKTVKKAVKKAVKKTAKKRQ